MYFILEESYNVVNGFVNKTEIGLKADSLGNLYFNVNQFKIDNINFIFGQQSIPFLMGVLFGYLYNLNLSDISDVKVNVKDINEFKLRNLCLEAPVIEISDKLGKAYINLLKSFEKVSMYGMDMFNPKYKSDFINLLSKYLIFCSYWTFEKTGKVAVVEEIQDSNYAYLCLKNLKSALK